MVSTIPLFLYLSLSLSLSLFLSLFLSLSFFLSFSLSLSLSLYLSRLRNDTDKGKLKKVVQDIRKICPRDYALLRAFFIASQREDSVRIYDLPESFKTRQEAALRRIYNLEGVDDVDLPPGAGTFFVCLNCSKIKAPIIRAGSAVNPRRSLTNSPSGVSYDMLDRVMYCSKLNNKKAKVSGSKKVSAPSPPRPSPSPSPGPSFFFLSSSLSPLTLFSLFPFCFSSTAAARGAL